MTAGSGVEVVEVGKIAVYDCKGGLQEKHTMRMLRRIYHTETEKDLQWRMTELLERINRPGILIPFPVGRKPRKRSTDLGPFNPFDGGGGPYNGGTPMPAPQEDVDEETRAA